MATPTADPKTEKGAPHATTQDQIAEMESEGQAQKQATTPADTEGLTDQDIDTAGTEADPTSKTATDSVTRPDDHLVETPGDTGAADIVGPTGEEMPTPKHKGVAANPH
ncbi:MAG: hypothetical protein ABI665_17030 [Vicinamibacterales bacterium]